MRRVSKEGKLAGLIQTWAVPDVVDDGGVLCAAVFTSVGFIAEVIGNVGIPGGSLLHYPKKAKVVSSKMLLRGVGGGNVDGVQFVCALTCVGAGARAGVDSDASQDGCELLEGAGQHCYRGPSEGVDGKVSVHSTCFSVELGKDNANRALGLIIGFPGFTPVVSWGGRGKAKAGVDVSGVGSGIIGANIVSDNVGGNRQERGAFDQHGPQRDIPFKEGYHFGV